MTQIRTLNIQKSTRERERRGKRKEEEWNCLFACEWEKETETESASCPRKWHVSSTHWVRYRRVPWLLRLVVREIHSVYQLKTSVWEMLWPQERATHPEWERWHLSEQNKPCSTQGTIHTSLPQHNTINMLCTPPCHKFLWKRRTYKHTPLLWQIKLTTVTAGELRIIRSAPNKKKKRAVHFPACWPLSGSCCQLACLNNGSRVIRLLSHTLFTSSRTGRPLAFPLAVLHPPS